MITNLEDYVATILVFSGESILSSLNFMLCCVINMIRSSLTCAIGFGLSSVDWPKL